MDHGLVRGTKHAEDRGTGQLPDQGQQDGRHQQQKKGGVLDPGRLFSVTCPSRDGKQRGAAAAKHVGKGSDQDHDRKAKADCAQGGSPDDRDAGDVDAVHDIVQEVQCLCGKHGKCSRRYI